MGFRTLRDRGGTPVVALDPGDLEVDGILDETGEIPDEQEMHVQRLAECVYLVRAVDGGTVPELQEQLAIRA